MLKQALTQLETVARRSRWLLLIQRLSQAVTAALVLVLFLGVMDWVLRLPGAVRLLIDLAALGVFGLWFWSRLGRVVRFKPSLEQLALRAERVYPDLQGVFASAVCFAAQPAEAMSRHSAVLAGASQSVAEDRLRGRDLTRLINTGPTRVALLACLIAVVLIAAVSGTKPAWSWTVLNRWVLPLGDTAWPKRVTLEWANDQAFGTKQNNALSASSAPFPGAGAGVAALDTALGVTVRVTRGDYDGLRVRLSVRDEASSGLDKTVLMQPLGDGLYRFVIEPRVETTVESEVDAPTSILERTLELKVSAGDGVLEPVKVRLVTPPRVVRGEAVITPPAYAADLMTSQTHTAEGTDGLGVRALAGSRVDMSVRLNKSIDGERSGLTGAEPESVRIEPRGVSSGLVGESLLEDDRVLSPFAQDAEGFKLRDAPRYRFTAESDRVPEVAIDPLPVGSVLPTAVLPVRAVGQDDVGLSVLRLEAHAKDDDASDRAALAADYVPELSDAALVVPALEARRPELVIEHDLSIGSLGAVPGQTLLLVARANDVYEQDGEKHAEQAVVRRLSVIDETTFLDSIQRLFSGLRDQVDPIVEAQSRATRQSGEQAQSTQGQVSAQLSVAEHGLKEIDERIKLNRFEDQDTAERMAMASSALGGAKADAERAKSLLGEDEPAARAAQAKVQEQLNDLMDLLSAGQSTAMIQSQLRQLQSRQQDLASRTREAQRQTAGLSQEQLTDQQRQALAGIAAEQRQLSNQAQRLTERIEDTAAQLQDSAQRLEDQAAAEALKEAGQTARANALSETMQSAADNAQDNQLSEAQAEQAEALETLEEMLGQVQGAKTKRKDLLKSQMRELEQVLAGLVAAQQLALDHLTPIRARSALKSLVPEQTDVRQKTMLARRDAEAARETEPLAEWIVAAIDEQANALRALNNGQGMDADAAERSALAALNKALDGLKKMRRQAEVAEAEAQREKLAEMYTELAERQLVIMQSVQTIAPAGSVSRRQRPLLIQQAGIENTLLEEVGAIQEEVQDTVVFVRMHQRIAESGTRARQALTLGQADRGVAMDLKRVHTTLVRLAEALAPDEDDSPFEEAQQAGGGGASGGGSGGGDQPGEQETIPPLAELKLLRSLQADLLEETRFVSSGSEALDAQRLLQEQVSLIDQQSQILEMGQALGEKLSGEGGGQ